MDIVAIMPCRGRPEQTVENVRRLLATAGLEHGRAWWLYLAGGEEETGLIWRVVNEIARSGQSVTIATSARPRESYWQALEMVTTVTEETLLVNLANDLLPGRNWLARGVSAYRARFGDGDGLMGFNDGLHGPEHSSHFLISRNLLDCYGGWPTWYQHNFGDTELCRRAQADGLYGKAAWAVLFHDHLENGAADDAVYQEGRATYDQDARLFEERRRAGWPRVATATSERPSDTTSAAAPAASSSG